MQQSKNLCASQTADLDLIDQAVDLREKHLYMRLVSGISPEKSQLLRLQTH